MSNRSARSERRAARRRNQRILIGVILILILAAAAFIVYNGSARKEAATLKIEDIQVGTGQEAKTGDTVSVHYTGWLANGTKFDSSLDSGQPFDFTLGQGDVIRGWDQGVVGMKVGGKRRLIIPPELAYGSRDYGPIPANSTLTFEIELLGIR